MPAVTSMRNATVGVALKPSVQIFVFIVVIVTVEANATTKSRPSGAHERRREIYSGARESARAPPEVVLSLSVCELSLPGSNATQKRHHPDLHVLSYSLQHREAKIPQQTLPLYDSSVQTNATTKTFNPSHICLCCPTAAREQTPPPRPYRRYGTHSRMPQQLSSENVVLVTARDKRHHQDPNRDKQQRQAQNATTQFFVITC